MTISTDNERYREQLESIDDAQLLLELFKTQDSVGEAADELEELRDSLGTLIDVVATRFAPAATNEAMALYREANA
jgi:hypothetical protein